MTETTIRNTLPSEEEDMINLMTCFGWVLQSSQSIPEEGAVKLTFTRNTEIPNHQKLQDLENEYRAKAALIQLHELQKPVFNFEIAPILFFCGVIPLIIYIVMHSKKMKAWEEEKQKYVDDFNSSKDGIIKKAISLLK